MPAFLSPQSQHTFLTINPVKRLVGSILSFFHNIGLLYISPCGAFRELGKPNSSTKYSRRSIPTHPLRLGAVFGVINKEHYGMLLYFLEWSILRVHHSKGKPRTDRFFPLFWFCLLSLNYKTFIFYQL